MIDMESHIKAVVAQAPPPTPDQIARLRLIVAPHAGGALTRSEEAQHAA